MYHATTKDRLESILAHGLRRDQAPTLTEEGDWSFEHYGCAPIFLGLHADHAEFKGYIEHAPIILRVDMTGLPVVADFPSLTNTGAYYEDDHFWWPEGQEPDGLPDMVIFRDLLQPNHPVCLRAIELTQSCACLVDITPDRITILASA